MTKKINKIAHKYLFDSTIKREALDQLVQHSYISIVGHMVILLVVVYVFLNITPIPILLWGSIIHLIILLGRTYIIVYYPKLVKTNSSKKALKTYVLYQQVGVFLSGLAWGFSCLLFQNNMPHEYHFFMTSILVGMGGVSITTLGFILSLYLLFIVPMFTIYAVWFFIQGGELYSITVILLLGVTLLYYITAKRYNSNYYATILGREKAQYAQKEMVQRLSIASELKDNETGMHITRMSQYAYLLALKVTKDKTYAQSILFASSMHDVGKIGIPDCILLKEGKLDKEEWETMQSHTLIGKRLLENSQSELLQLCESVAYTHHEKYDGSGYPQGLKGTDIPLEGRITAITDVFDALVSKRPYKEPWTNEKAFAFLEEEAGKHFDPELIAHFIAIKDKVITFQELHQD
jgi:hypothetical protein